MSEKPGVNRIGQSSLDEQNMAQIREILFGAQSRQMEQQFTRLENRLGEQEQALKSLLNEQISDIGQQLQTLRDELNAQDRRQDSALEEMHGSLSALLKRLDERLTILDSDQHDARQQHEQLARQHGDALDALEQRTTNRGQLADLLQSLAEDLRKPASQ